MRNYLILSALGLSMLAAAPALAADGWASGNRLNVPQGEWLSPSQISEKLSAQGYKVHEIEADDGAYEVEMIDKNGTRIDTHVHPATAELLPGYDD
jgi:hypothetical protein